MRYEMTLVYDGPDDGRVEAGASAFLAELDGTAEMAVFPVDGDGETGDAVAEVATSSLDDESGRRRTMSVWVVLTSDIDGAYVFEDEDDAQRFAEVTGGTAYQAGAVIDRELATEMIAEHTGEGE